MISSVPVMAEDLYLVRFSGGKEVVFELTSRHVRLVKDAKWKEVGEVPLQKEHALLKNFETPVVEIGTARWFTLKEPTSSLSRETKPLRFELLPNGTVYDRSESRVLVLSCQGTIKAFTLRESMQELVVLNREVTDYYHNPGGKFIGAAFGDDELTFIQFTGEVVRRVPIEGLGILFLDGEDTSLITLVQSVYSTHWINPLNWLRTLAGHPKQSQRVTVSIFDSSGVQIDSLHLTDAQDPEQFTVFKIIR
jgi:hypothetical protein